MNSKIKTRLLVLIGYVALLIPALIPAPMANAQAPSRFVGTITGISGNTLTIKTDAGEERQVTVPATAAVKRIAPGQKDLNTAETLPFSDLASGDRVLVKLDPSSTATPPEAAQIISVKQADVALKQQKDREDWQRRGAGGLVKSVDAAAAVILLNSGSGANAKTITVHTSAKTMLKRYAPSSVRFDAALPAPISEIRVGDQLRARGSKNAAGTEIDAEEVISGSFLNIAGTVTAVDAAASTVTVKDLATKKQVTIQIAQDSQMRRLPEMMARMLAARLKGVPPAQGNAGGGPAATAAGSGMQQRNMNGGMQAGGGQGGGDPQQMLNRAPVIKLAEIQKGEAVMLVATDGSSAITAVTLLAGVEPLLEAPAASQNLLSNWSMGSGAPDAVQ